jgi:hypothetical protein
MLWPYPSSTPPQPHRVHGAQLERERARMVKAKTPDEASVNTIFAKMQHKQAKAEGDPRARPPPRRRRPAARRPRRARRRSARARARCRAARAQRSQAASQRGHRPVHQPCISSRQRLAPRCAAAACCHTAERSLNFLGKEASRKRAIDLPCHSWPQAHRDSLPEPTRAGVL